MAIVYFGSLLFNAIMILLPIAVLTTFFIAKTAKVQGRSFLKFLPYTIALSLGVTREMLVVLAARLAQDGVYALLPFAEVTQRPGMLLLVLFSVATYLFGTSALLPQRARPLARHVAIALGLSATIQCAAVLFTTGWFYALLHVPLHY